MNIKTKKLDKVFLFLENWLITLMISFFLISIILNYLFIQTDNTLADFGYYDFFDIKVRIALENMKSSLFSIAAIFIGIYVTVFILLGSIKVDSIFAYLNEFTFKKLIIFIRNAFIASFSYLIMILCVELIYQNFEDIPFIFIILNATIVLYMFATALRFGVILYIAFNKDLRDLQPNIEKHRKYDKETKDLRFRLDNFLKDVEKENDIKRNEELAKKLRNKD